MTSLYRDLATRPAYWDKKSARSPEEWFGALADSTTLYVGNLSYYVSEEQVFEIFSTCGNVTRIVIGLNKNRRMPCGFCFVQFSTHEEAANACLLLNGSFCDERIVRCDWDTGKGISEDRKFGRGARGDQTRDDRV
eukprot:Blabericola_migrator_1__1701@NODE_1458_length_4514_cov_172_331684_g560_i1_p3_GENE_NODE_1458_length_4514_cov_172_331684_g560_i1NODE_1458_length_4514_cov_172_331684_g560_i1_p3_ORF_typecomplete_len136_score10_09RRM_1/PF00076_22/1_3e18RRM_5/PF13893_6/8_1e10RRM_8/PF11835_8/2_2e05RRM_7/PF16367_5/0_0011RRM_occluded/PF16842_5/0_0088Nup35_RRM_2/PF14605_6/0_019Nup35_RRM_2/PF14605_6/6_1e03PHM7_cyt/PF14703_6/2_3e03PHM7_cyt/PF14703_6/0_068RRM_Rrp7/PF17799_1/0_078_NODE_1458_length_4514_cov_172_331684_g560_i12